LPLSARRTSRKSSTTTLVSAAAFAQEREADGHRRSRVLRQRPSGQLPGPRREIPDEREALTGSARHARVARRCAAKRDDARRHSTPPARHDSTCWMFGGVRFAAWRCPLPPDESWQSTAVPGQR
jgi:hypothetical protein